MAFSSLGLSDVVWVNKEKSCLKESSLSFEESSRPKLSSNSDDAYRSLCELSSSSCLQGLGFSGFPRYCLKFASDCSHNCLKENARFA